MTRREAYRILVLFPVSRNGLGQSQFLYHSPTWTDQGQSGHTQKVTPVTKPLVTNGTTESVTGDTLSTKDGGLELAAIEYPAAAYFASVHPKSRNDVDKLSTLRG